MILNYTAMFCDTLNVVTSNIRYFTQLLLIFFQEHNTFKLMFDTPGSQINREISAIVAFDVIKNNVTVLLHSAGNSLIAKGKIVCL